TRLFSASAAQVKNSKANTINSPIMKPLYSDNRGSFTAAPMEIRDNNLHVGKVSRRSLGVESDVAELVWCAAAGSHISDRSQRLWICVRSAADINTHGASAIYVAVSDL